jgi:hypothetical protein
VSGAIGAAPPCEDSQADEERYYGDEVEERRGSAAGGGEHEDEKAADDYAGDGDEQKGAAAGGGGGSCGTFDGKDEQSEEADQERCDEKDGKEGVVDFRRYEGWEIQGHVLMFSR